MPRLPAAMLQEKTARALHTLRVADVVRTYARTQIGYLFSSFDMLYVCNRTGMYQRENTARHSSTAKTAKMKPKFGKKKKCPSPLAQ